MAANMDARGGIRTVVRPDASCASACAMALFVSGETRVVCMGGHIGIHSCAMPDGTPPNVTRLWPATLPRMALRERPGIVFRVGRDFSKRPVSGGADEFFELPVGDWGAVDPKAADADAADRRFLGIMPIGAHAERAAGYPNHVWRGCLLRGLR
jgi:hypothetical protein